MFQPGDILLYHAEALKISNIVPRLIRLITGNKVTHVALYLGEVDKKHIILDALSNGIYIKEMSNIINRDDDFNLYGIARLPIEKDLYGRFYDEALKFNNKPYGILTIINLLFQHGKTVFTNKEWTTWFKSKKGYICSEVCQLVYENVVNTQFPKKANLTEPDDYLTNPWKVYYLNS
jgi:hypothetical protein